MTIQFNYPWNGYSGIQTLADAEESRLVGIGVARYYTPYMDGGPSNPEANNLELTESGLQIGGAAPTSAQRASVRAGIGADLLTLAEMMQRTVSAANPFDSPAMASPPTIVTTGGTDPTGPKSLAYFDHPELFKWSGATQGAAGAWLQNSGGYARPRMPRMAPAGAQVANQGGWSCSVRTDAPIIKFNVQNTNTFFVSVDGERTNDAGYTSTGNFSLWVPLATRKLRTITI